MRLARHYCNRVFMLIVSGLMLMAIVACSSPAPALPGTSQPDPRIVEVTKVVEVTVAVTIEVTPTPEPTLATTWPISLPVQMGTIVPVPNEPISTTNVNRIVEVARWRKEGLKDAQVVRYSPDGKLLAIGTWAGIYIYDAQTMELLKYIDTGERISSLAFSPDGSLLASGPEAMSDVDVTLRSTETWEVKRRFGLNTNTVGHIAFSPDGSLIAADTAIWQVDNGKKLKTLKFGQDGYGSAGFGDFSPDGKLIIVHRGGGVQYTRDQIVTRKSALQIWDIDSEKVLRTFQVPNDTAVTGVAFSPDGASVAAGIQIGGVNDYTQGDKATGAMRLWRVRDGALLQNFDGLAHAVRQVAFSPDGSLIASSSGSGGEVRLWQVKDGSSLAVLQEDNSGRDIGGSIDFSPDGSTIALASNSVKIWQVSDGVLLKKIGGETSLGGRVMFSPDGTRLAVSGGVIQVSDGTLITTTGISAFSPDGTMEVIGDQVRASNDGTLLFTLPYTSILAVTFSPDGTFLASTSFLLDRIDVWQTHNWELVYSMEFPAPTMVRGLSFSPNEPWLAAGLISAERIINNDSLILSPIQSEKGRVQIWDVQNKKLVTTLPEHQSAPLVAFSRDGAILASDVGTLGDGPSTVQLWNTVDWTPGKKLTWGGIFVGSADSMTFSPDGSILAVGANGDVRLWQMPDGKLLREIKAHTDNVSGLEFSPDGLWLASSSQDDGTVRLWGVKP